jgi:hypothetical protein
VPIDHAWLEYSGKVWDPTLVNKRWKLRVGKEQGEYVGVIIPKELIPKHQLKTRHYCPVSWEPEYEKLIWKEVAA